MKTFSWSHLVLSVVVLTASQSRTFASPVNPEVNCQFKGGNLVLPIGIDRTKRIAYDPETGALLRSYVAPESSVGYTVVFFVSRLPFTKGSLESGAVPVAIMIFRNTLKATLLYTTGDPSSKPLSLKGACQKRPQPLI